MTPTPTGSPSPLPSVSWYTNHSEALVVSGPGMFSKPYEVHSRLNLSTNLRVPRCVALYSLAALP